MAILPDAARRAAEVVTEQRRLLEETTARMMGRMCDEMLRAHRRHARLHLVPIGAGGGFGALSDADVALLAITCQPPGRRRA
jgi:hypothetical protein